LLAAVSTVRKLLLDQVGNVRRKRRICRHFDTVKSDA
jgi:hypothetical protein